MFDPVAPWVDAGDVLDAVESFRPRHVSRTRPPEPVAVTDGDPLQELRERTERTTRRRVNQAEALLDGQGQAEITDRLRAAGWPGAASVLAELLALSAADHAYRVALGDALIIDRDGAVTYVAPVHLHADRTAGLPLVPDEVGAEELTGGD